MVPQRSPQHPFISRRDVLQLGALGVCGLSLPTLLNAQDDRQSALRNAADRPRAKARSCIILFQQGGPAQHDTFDMKPDAPTEIRGEFQPIATPIPGYPLCEHMPLVAGQVHRLAVVRSVHHNDPQHNNAGYAALTGTHPPLLPNTVEALAGPRPDNHPPFGAVLARLGNSAVPTPWVSLPYPAVNGIPYPGQTSGFLGAPYEPLWLRPDPKKGAEFTFPELESPAELSPPRIHRRHGLLRDLEGALASIQDSSALASMTAFQSRAVDLITSAATRRALRLDEEDPRTRDRYGRNVFGQSCLLARRLVEAGVPLVNVYSVGFDGFPGPLPLSWDTHWDNFKFLKEGILPIQDRGFAVLLEDLADRGLLDETLVVWFGEFGRSPQINAQAGREHWPFVYPVVFAGGGLQGGTLYGSSDPHGKYPASNPVTPQDIAATIYHCLDLDAETRLADRFGRPVEIGSGGKAITGILA
jgi:hypothetical protein